MNLLETFRSAVEAIVSHRLRSALTVLGMLIGIAAVIMTVGLGEGATSSVNSAISSLGTNLLIVTPGSSKFAADSAWFWICDDADVRRRSSAWYPHCRASALRRWLRQPRRLTRSLPALKIGRRQIVGTTPSWLSVRDRVGVDREILHC